ncbi:phage major capsid protein [Methylobacterium brachiatum]
MATERRGIHLRLAQDPRQHVKIFSTDPLGCKYEFEGVFSAKLKHAYVLFYVTKRVGGGVQDFDAIKVLKFG